MYFQKCQTYSFKPSPFSTKGTDKMKHVCLVLFWWWVTLKLPHSEKSTREFLDEGKGLGHSGRSGFPRRPVSFGSIPQLCSLLFTHFLHILISPPLAYRFSAVSVFLIPFPRLRWIIHQAQFSGPQRINNYFLAALKKHSVDADQIKLSFVCSATLTNYVRIKIGITLLFPRG